MKKLRIEVITADGEELVEILEGFAIDQAAEEAEFMANGGTWEVIIDYLDEDGWDVIESERVADSETYRSR